MPGSNNFDSLSPMTERELLQAILRELRSLNRVAYCPDAQKIPELLRQIESNTARLKPQKERLER